MARFESMKKGFYTPEPKQEESDKNERSYKMEEFIQECCDISEKMHPFDFIPLICTMIYTYSEKHDLGKYGCKDIIGAIVNNMLEPDGEALDPLDRLL